MEIDPELRIRTSALKAMLDRAYTDGKLHRTLELKEAVEIWRKALVYQRQLDRELTWIASAVAHAKT
jgi:hypothetical protein